MVLYALAYGKEEKPQKNYCSQKLLASLAPSDNAELYTRLFWGCRPKGKAAEYINDFYKTGTGHLLSISGLHIGSISLTIFILANTICQIFISGTRKYKIPFFYLSMPLGFLLSLIYVVYIGIEVPRLRSLIMLGFVMASFIFPLFRNRLLVLAVTALIILVFIPDSVYSYSFYYSFGSVFAILFIASNKNIHVCLIIFVFLIPLNLHSSGELNPMHIVSNFVLVPLFCVFYFPLMLFLKLNFILGFSKWPLLLMDRFTELFLKLVNFFSVFSEYSSYKTVQINTFEALFLYILIIVFFLLFKYHKCINKTSSQIIYSSILLMAMIFGVYVLFNYKDQTLITVFDLQKPPRSNASGDIILLNMNEKNVVIDTGHGFFDTSSTIKKLKRLKIDAIDFLIITHRDLDHIGGLEKFKEAFLIKDIVISPHEYKNLLNKVNEGSRTSNYILACNGSSIRLGRSEELEFINPNCNIKETEPNRGALSFILKLQNIYILFSSDVPFKFLSESIKEIPTKEKALVLQLSHHCSKQDNPPKRFRDIKPMAAFCTRDKSLLRRGMLDSKNFNFPIFATGKCGDIKIKPENGGFWIFSEKCPKKYLQFKKI